MSGKRAKEKRKLTAEEEAAVKVLYELIVRITSDGKAAVATNNEQALNDPIVYTSIVTGMNRAVVDRWTERRQALMAKQADAPRIIQP